MAAHAACAFQGFSWHFFSILLIECLTSSQGPSLHASLELALHRRPGPAVTPSVHACRPQRVPAVHGVSAAAQAGVPAVPRGVSRRGAADHQRGVARLGCAGGDAAHRRGAGRLADPRRRKGAQLHVADSPAFHAIKPGVGRAGGDAAHRGGAAVKTHTAGMLTIEFS